MKESSLAILLLSLGCLLSIAPVLGKPADEEADGEEGDDEAEEEEEGGVTDEDTDYLGHEIKECATLDGEKEGAPVWTYRCCELPEIVKNSDTGFEKRFLAKNVLTLEGDSRDSKDHGNYWLAAHKKSKGQGFKVDLKCNMLASAILLKNTHNGDHRDRGTKKFKVLGSKKLEGPWEVLLENELADSRKDSDPPLKTFPLKKEVELRFLHFKLVDFWGKGGGLQYFFVEPGCVIDEETDYHGHDIGKAVKVKNQQACATLTGTKEGGLFWTYQASTKKCWVKTSKEGKTEGAGLVSGSVGCAVKETDGEEEGDEDAGEEEE